MGLTISQKGLALVLVPLLFQLAFVLLVVRLQRGYAEAQHWAAHSKEVIAQARGVHAGLAEAQAAARGFALTGDPGFAAPYDRAARDLPDRLARLEELVGDNPAQAARTAEIRADATALLDWQREVVQLVRGGATDEGVGRIRAGRGKQLMEELREQIGAVLDEEQRLDAERTAALEGFRGRLNVLFVAGGVAAVAGTVVLGYAFRRGIGRRFDALAENTRRLAVGTDLPPPLAGTDEVARLDRVFRDMAADLTRTGDALRASEERFRLTVEGIRDYAILMLDPGGRVVSWNAGAGRITGYRADEIIGQHFSRFYPPAAVARGWPGQELERAAADGRFEDEGWRVRTDGSRYWANVIITAIRGGDGELRGFAKITRDVTERKRAEDEVRRLNAELEERVLARTAELEEANRDLTHKNAENEMFVYSVSHDLRSPLVNLQGFSKELDKGFRVLAAVLDEAAVPPAVRDRGRALLDGKMAKAVGFIQSAVLRLSTIIDALLRLSRAGRVEYRWEAVDVAGVVGRVVAAAQGTVAEKGAAVRVGDLPPAWGDRAAVEQVFANLVGNALTYLDPVRPGVVEVGSPPDGAAGTPPGFRTYFVRDNGLGIPEGHRPKIFQAFQRAHPGVGSGEGLGLAIVARVVERHRGKVWVESRPGEGSTFYVTFPAPPAGGVRPGPNREG